MRRVILALGIVFLFATCKKEIPQKQLTVNVTPEVGGSVTPKSGTYPMGSTVKVLATPSPEYIFKEWTGGFTGTTNPANVIMDVDKTVTAVFEKREYPLSLTIVGFGTVKEEIIKIASTATNYKSGTTVRLTPQPSEGYEFKRWSGDDTTSKSPLDLIVSKAINLTCTFEKEEAIKFSTNLDTGSYNVLDTLPLVITVSSKLPKAGILYSILVNWTDSSKQIFKLDTSLTVSSLSLNIPGLKKRGAYSLSVTVTSKSTSTNTLSKNLNAINKTRVYKNYTKTSYELSNFDTWFSSSQLIKADGTRYTNNPFIDEQSTQIDIDGDGLEDLFYFESYDLQISPTPNPPPSIFMNNGNNLKQTNYTGTNIKNPHGVKLLIGDFNNDSLPDIFSNVAVDPPFFAFPFLNDNCHLILNSKNGLSSVKEFPDQGFWYTGCSGDIDNDGDLDIITFNFHSQGNGVKSRIMWNDGKANFTIDFNGIGDIPVADISELVDINVDGFLDLVINFHPNGPSRINDFRILWGNGKGFNLNNSTAISLSGDKFLQNIDFIDIDGDGIKEIIPSGNYSSSSGTTVYFISFYKSDDKGKTFTDKTIQYIDNNIANRFYHIRVQDIDKNGLFDIFSGERKDNIRWEWNGSKFIKK
jgi:hypothetical protein